MSRVILIFGQPASGKSFSLRTLDPASTVVIDGDLKGMLPWRGSKQQYNPNKQNFFKCSSLNSIYSNVIAIGNKESYKHIKTVVIDGFNNAIMTEVMNNNNPFMPNADNQKSDFKFWDQLAKKVFWLITSAQSLREDLTVVFITHVELADPYSATDVDQVFTLGKCLKDKVKIEGKFNYVFYAKSEEGNFFFEVAPMKSTARAPYECFSEPRIPNDLAAAIKIIEEYESHGKDKSK